MKKFISFSLVLVLVIALLAGCGSNQPATNEQQESNESTSSNENASNNETKYEDGIYFAQEDGFSESSGWKYVVTLEVKDGKIVSADWNGANINGGPNKDTVSELGEYGMVANGGAQAEWHEQAEKAEAYLLETQDPTAIEYTDEEGHTDAISGVSIHVVEFFDLAEKALNKGPVGKGQYKDGNYRAEMSEFSNGWKYYADLTVINGYIVAADWDGIPEEGDKTKDEASASGEYGMVEKGGAQAPWVEQANKAEAYLLETQDPTAIEYTDEEGHTDAISGVSIHVVEFFELAEKALESAKEGSVDAVTTASIVTEEEAFLNAISENGTWIIATLNDLTFDQELVLEGEFHNKDDEAQDLYRKIAPYTQDADHNVTGRFTITAPKLTVKSPNTRIQGGTFVGDVYVESNGFTLRDAKIEGNLYFASEEAKSSSDLTNAAEVTGAVEVK